jgi:hypothetical protein
LGTFIDTYDLKDSETIGRDKDSNDTNSFKDWQNATNKADPFGVDATTETPGARNLDCIIPEFQTIAIPMFLIFVLIAIIRKKYHFIIIRADREGVVK